MPVNALANDANQDPAAGLYDTVSGHVVAEEAGPVTLDASGHEFAPATITLGDGLNPLTRVTIGSIHNADNQPISAVNSLFTTGINQVVNPIFNANRQLETGFDNVPSHGIITSAQQLEQVTVSTATGAITANQTTNAVITPTTMLAGFVPNNAVVVDAGTANAEQGYIVSATSTTVTVQPVNGSPSTPSWKNAHSGTYRLQAGIYNVMRDAKGENSGADGTGTNLALEYEWGSGGPLLVSGLPSLNQYDRETLIVGQGVQSQAITSTSSGATSITMTSAVGTLTPGHPIRLSGGSVPETVYVDQSYVPGSNTVIPLKSPVVNASQTLATWQVYTPNGPGAGKVMLYGEGMEGIILGDLGNPGFGEMMQANSDNITLAASQSFGVGTFTTSDQTNVNGKGAVFFLNITAIGTGTITLSIQGKDPVTSNYYTILADAFAITANGFYTFEVFPGATVVTSTSGTAPGTGAIRTAVSHVLPKTYRVSAAVATAAVTAQIDASLMS